MAESKLATTDALLLFWLVACQFSLWELARGPSRRAAAVFWVCLALATLTVGVVAFLVSDFLYGYALVNGTGTDPGRVDAGFLAFCVLAFAMSRRAAICSVI